MERNRPLFSKQYYIKIKQIINTYYWLLMSLPHLFTGGRRKGERLYLKVQQRRKDNWVYHEDGGRRMLEPHIEMVEDGEDKNLAIHKMRKTSDVADDTISIRWMAWNASVPSTRILLYGGRGWSS
jgi:hypothetical protein